MFATVFECRKILSGISGQRKLNPLRFQARSSIIAAMNKQIPKQNLSRPTGAARNIL